jgi:membrane associated rhomboid family serine protease
MIAIPLTKKISWRTPPMVTIAIILVNVFVFFVIQGEDDARFMEAQNFYFESFLDRIEIPIYLDFLVN